LLVSFAVSASQNQFFAVTAPVGFGQAKTDFAIPKEQGDTNKPGQPGGLAPEDIGDIKSALEKKEARLLFHDSSSIEYFLKHVINPNDIRNIDIKNSYEALVNNGNATNDPKNNLRELTGENLTQGTIPDTFFNKLLASLQHASNTVNSNDNDNYNDAFFNMTVLYMNSFSSYTENSAPKSGPNINNDSILNRLKRAFVFEWSTFRVPQDKYSDTQKREFKENSSYINFIKLLRRGAALTFFSYIIIKIQSFFDSKKSWFK
jgi:hypothetical protein